MLQKIQSGSVVSSYKIDHKFEANLMVFIFNTLKLSYNMRCSFSNKIQKIEELVNSN